MYWKHLETVSITSRRRPRNKFLGLQVQGANHHTKGNPHSSRPKNTNPNIQGVNVNMYIYIYVYLSYMECLGHMTTHN